LEAQKQNVTSLKSTIGKQNVDPLQLGLGEQNVTPSKLRLGEQNIASLQPRINESSNICGLELTMMIVCNSNDEIILNINWKFRLKNGGLDYFRIHIH
jgi:hypothetical protein